MQIGVVKIVLYYMENMGFNMFRWCAMMCLASLKSPRWKFCAAINFQFTEKRKTRAEEMDLECSVIDPH